MRKIENLFKTVKNTVTAREAADFYGVKFGRNGLAHCPFHDDSTASMKVDERYYCFGCGATGDVTDLTAGIFGLKPRDAAIKIYDDFHVGTHRHYSGGHAAHVAPIYRKPPEKEGDKWMKKATSVLCDYLHILENWKEIYAPEKPGDEWHPLFCEALQNIDRIDHILDELMESEPEEHRVIYECYGREVRDIEERLERSDG